MVGYHIPKLLLMIWFKFPDEVDEFPNGGVLEEF